MRLSTALAGLALLAGCASPAPPPAVDNATAPGFVAPPRGSLIVLLPAPQSKGIEAGEAQMGTTSALSIELLALTPKGGFALRRYGGATLPFETNVAEVKSELRKNLFDTDGEIAEAVRVALEPLTKP